MAREVVTTAYISEQKTIGLSDGSTLGVGRCIERGDKDCRIYWPEPVDRSGCNTEVGKTIGGRGSFQQGGEELSLQQLSVWCLLDILQEVSTRQLDRSGQGAGNTNLGKLSK